MIYFITDGHYTYITRTHDIREVKNSLQKGNPKHLSVKNHLETDCPQFYTELLKGLSKYRVLGDWYSLPMYMDKYSLEQFETHFENVEEDLQLLAAVDREVARATSIGKALLVEHLSYRLSHNNKAKVNMSGVSSVLPLSQSSVQRYITELIEEEGYLGRDGKTYWFTKKFYKAFPQYVNRLTL